MSRRSIILYFLITGMNRLINFPILEFQIRLLSPGGDFRRQRRIVNDSRAYEACSEGFFFGRHFHFDFFPLGEIILLFNGVPGGLTMSMLSRYSLKPMKIVRERNKHNVRYDTIIKCIAKKMPGGTPLWENF